MQTKVKMITEGVLHRGCKLPILRRSKEPAVDGVCALYSMSKMMLRCLQN